MNAHGRRLERRRRQRRIEALVRSDRHAPSAYIDMLECELELLKAAIDAWLR